MVCMEIIVLFNKYYFLLLQDLVNSQIGVDSAMRKDRNTQRGYCNGCLCLAWQREELVGAIPTTRVSCYSLFFLSQQKTKTFLTLQR